jgi:hypothetical protein
MTTNQDCFSQKWQLLSAGKLLDKNFAEFAMAA